MINNEPITTLATALLAIDDDNIDALDALDALRPLLDTHHFNALCAMLDICPMHICDIDICADDDIDECAHFRA